MRANQLPQYRSSILVDGLTYHVSIRFSKGEGIYNMPAHSHSQYELHVFTDGSAVIQCSDLPEVTLIGGDGCIIHPHVYHRRLLGPDVTKCYEMTFDCPKGAPLPTGDAKYTRLHCTPALIGYFSTLEHELSMHRMGTDTSVYALCALILITVLRELSGAPKELTPRKNNTIMPYGDIIDNYFAMHYFDSISATDLAERVGVTTRQLSRIMQQHYGCTFRQRLLEIRLYHAQQYLTTTAHPIWQVAIACGFTGEGSFNTAFRKSLGCTPSQYRKRMAELSEK